MATARGRRRATVILRLAAATGLAVIGLWPVSAPAAERPGTEKIDVPSIAESWYAKLDVPELVPGQPELPELPLPDLPDLDPCTLPVGCLPEVPALPVPLPVEVPTEVPDDPAEAIYPAGTLHVDLLLGAPTARAYLVPDLTLLPAGSELLDGELVLPVSEEPTAGNRNVETARFGACLTTTEVTDGETGRLLGSPEFDCEQAATEAVFHPKDDAFVVDLGPFIEKWKAGAPNYGVALVPTTVKDAAGALAAESTWHVALNGSRVTTGTPSVSHLTYKPAPVAEPEPEPTEEPTEAPTTPANGGPAPSNGGGIVTPTPPVAPDAPIAPTDIVPTTPQPLEAAPYALLNSPWYTYKGVVFLPLAFLVAMGLTGRSLTRPLNVVTRRRA